VILSPEIGGGWASADEAATHYISLIDNMEVGLTWLRDHLGMRGIFARKISFFKM
jgi:hypothetical protein